MSTTTALVRHLLAKAFPHSHKQVTTKLAENGGKVPDELKH
jgi:hypothetical protein